MEEVQLFEQAFQQYGLVGLILSFLIVGPGFTYLKAKNAQINAEMKAHELIGEFIKNEQERTYQLETQVRAILNQLGQLELEVERLDNRFKEAQRRLLEAEEFKELVTALTQRIAKLEILNHPR